MDLLTINDRPGTYPPSFYAHDPRPLTQCEAAAGDISCDVCVVGGGFTGLSAALHLAQRGYSVRLLEAQRIGFGASGRNGGQVGQGQRLEQHELEKMVGMERARDLWDIAREAVELVREIARTPQVEADFHPGVIHATHRPGDLDDMRAQCEHLRTRYGYDGAVLLDRAKLRKIVQTDAYVGGVQDMRAGHIDPLRLAIGMGRLAQGAGATLHEASRVRSITPLGAGSEGSLLRTDKAVIAARHVILACNGYIGSLNRDVAHRVMPINNYIIATEPLSDTARAAILSRNVAVADAKFVVNYFRFSDDNRLLFGGTESYRYRFPRNIAHAVRRPMTQIFPQTRGLRVDYAWGGTLGITMSRMPHFARYAGNMLSVSGFSGHGIAMGTMSGKLAAHAVAGRAERFDLMASLPSPKFPGGQTMRQPLLMLAMVWYGLRDRL